MIKFVSSSIKRAARGVAAGVESSVMAVQSLNMALSILSVHLTQVNVPMADWERMLESQEDLKILEDLQPAVQLDCNPGHCGGGGEDTEGKYQKDSRGNREVERKGSRNQGTAKGAGKSSSGREKGSVESKDRECEEAEGRAEEEEDSGN